MSAASSRILVLVLSIAVASLGAFAQATDPQYPTSQAKPDKDNYPKIIAETLEKMRIEKDKKDHEQMVSRGQEVLKITEQLEKSYSQHGQLSGQDYSKIANVEKLVKKIRDELGADGEDDDDKKPDLKPTNTADGMKRLRDMTTAMFDELKKTTRFSISLSAIQTTNSVLRIVRFLRGGN